MEKEWRADVPMCSYEVDQPGLFERACGPTMPTSGATATHFTSSIIPSTFPCGRGAGAVFPVAERCQQHRSQKLPRPSRYTKRVLQRTGHC